MSVNTHVESSFNNETFGTDSPLLARIQTMFRNIGRAVAAARLAEELHYVSDVQLRTAGTSRREILTRAMNQD